MECKFRPIPTIPVLVALAVAGCSVLPISADDGPKLLPAVKSLAVPFERQNSANQCGLACVDTLTRFYYKPLSAAEQDGLREEAGTADGISGASLKAALEEAGYFVVVFPGTLSHLDSGLYHQVDMGRPSLVMTGAGPRHYCVVVGYDENEDTVTLLDPALGPRTLAAPDFLRIWKQANKFMLLALPDR